MSRVVSRDCIWVVYWEKPGVHGETPIKVTCHAFFIYTLDTHALEFVHVKLYNFGSGNTHNKLTEIAIWCI